MKKSLIFAAAGMLTFAMFGTLAHAESTNDKGSAAKYERHGRFMTAIQTPAPRSEAAAPATSKPAIVDKGDLGKYERQGRILRPITEVGLQGWSRGEASAPAGGVTHDHGINGKEHKNMSS